MKVSIDANDKAVGMDLQELSTAVNELMSQAENNETDPSESRVTVLINFRGGIKTLQAEV